MRGYSESDRGAFILTVSNGSSGAGGGGGGSCAPCAGGATLASQNSGVVSFTDSYDDQVTCSWAISCPQRSDHVHEAALVTTALVLDDECSIGIAAMTP